MTHRPGRSWRVTIVDEQPDGDRLHAVVMAGKVLTTDAELAERVCQLLNFQQRAMEVWGPVDGNVLRQTPDVDHTNGAREALAEVRRRLDAWVEVTDSHYEAQPEHLAAVVLGILRDAAAELGVDEDAPSGPLSAPVAAETVRVEGIGYPEPPAPLRGRVRPIKPPLGRTDSDERADVQRRMVMLAEHRPETAGSDGLGYGACVGCRQIWPCTASRDEREADQ